MNDRADRPRSSGGPLSTGELQAYLNRGYADASRRFFSRTWDVDDDPEAVARVADDGFDTPIDLGALEATARAIFGLVAERGGRVRGENLRRDLLLRGFGESRSTIRNLVVRGWLVALPNPGEHDCNLNSVLEQEGFLQRDLAVLAATYDRIDELADEESLSAPAWDQALADESPTSMEDLELNLLHLCSLIRRDPLKLNKDGTPNRRSLARVARGINMPGTRGEVAADLDLHDAEQLDYLSFLVSLARELHLLATRDGTCRTDYSALGRYFHSDDAERDRRLLDAVQRIRFWNEIDSLLLSRSTSRSLDEEHFSQSTTTGEPLIGARGFVISVLRRARFSDWVALDALALLCTQLDRHYLDRTLSQLQRKPDPDEFIHAVLERTLIWSGILETGTAEEGPALIRLTPRGARAMGLEHQMIPPSEEGCLIAQPNFEVMVFLDNAPASVLHDMYRVGERRKLSDRVATFQLTAESVQRGYALGADAESLLSLLEKWGHAPVPDSVSFELEDWERAHRRLTIHLGGASLRHPDPERFDLILGQLEHDLRDTEVELIRLGPRDAFVTDSNHQALQRAAEGHPSVQLDALGSPPQCLHFVDPLVLLVDPYECDVVTRVELDRIARHLVDESEERSLFFELDAEKIRERYPDDPLDGICRFLGPRCDGGLPAEQSLRLQAELDRAPRLHLATELTVVTFETLDVARRFCDLAEAPDFIERQLGPRAFVVDKDCLVLLEELIDELHLERCSAPFDDLADQAD